jgi:hypothetical protein
MLELLLLAVFIIIVVKLCTRNSFDSYHAHQMKMERAEARRARSRQIEGTWWYGTLQLIGAVAVMYVLTRIFNFT